MSRKEGASNPLAPKAGRIEKSKAKSKSRSSANGKVFKSAETVVDSDEEQAAVVSRASTSARGSKSKQLPKQAVAAVTSESESEASDSSSDEASVSLARSAPSAKPVTPESSDDSSEESDDSNSESGIENDQPKEKDQSSKEDDEDVDMSDSSSDASRRRPRAPTPDDLPRSQSAGHTSEIRPEIPYKPPPGYYEMAGNDIAFDPLNDNFRPSKRKQLFYISAPASIPLDELKVITIESLTNQEPIMSHDGRTYALRSDEDAKINTRLFLPGKRGYNVLRSKIEHALRLEQVIKIPEASTATSGVAKSSASALQSSSMASLSARVQPAGLKARNRPSGYGDGALSAIGLSDDEDQSSTRQPKRRKEAGKHVDGDEKKQKRKKRDAAAVQEKMTEIVHEATKTIDADQNTAPVEAKEEERNSRRQLEHDIEGGLVAPEQFDLGLIPAPAAGESQAKKEKRKKKKKDRAAGGV